MTRFALVALALSTAGLVCAQIPVNQNSLKTADFEKRVDDYMKLRNQASNGLPKLKPTDVPGAIAKHEQELAARLRTTRPKAAQGDIFTPEITLEFKRLVGISMQGASDNRVKKSLQHAEPVNLKLKVGDSYPHHIPLQTTPPTLLQNLPRLPKELEYRIVGQSLVLRDIGANLVVDFIPDAIPQ